MAESPKKIPDRVCGNIQQRHSRVHSSKPQRLPVVLTREEVSKLINALSGTQKIIGMLLYGAGLRLMECIRLRIKDIDFARNQIVIRPIKGYRDRITRLTP